MEHELRKAGTRVLVTGGTGFIGQHLVSALVARDHKVRVLDRRPPVCSLPDVEYVSGSVLDSALVDDTLRDIDDLVRLKMLQQNERHDRAALQTAVMGVLYKALES